MIRMKRGMISDIKRFAVHDGDGIRTTVFLKGCPLRCVWCHNPEGIASGRQTAYYAHKCASCGACAAVCPEGAQRMRDGAHVFERERCTACGACERACPNGAMRSYGETVSVEEVLTQLLEDREFYEASGGGITLSGGECLMQAEFCEALLRACRAEGLHTAVDTCGFVAREVLDRVIPFTNVFLYDVKAVDEDVHIRCTGRSNRRILENLNSRGCEIEVRVPLVPGWNDDQMEKIAALLKPLESVRRVRVLAYHRYAGSKYTALGMPDAMPENVPAEEMTARVQAMMDCAVSERLD